MSGSLQERTRIAPAWTPVRSRSYRADWIALIAYLVLAVILTYPLVLQFSTHVPGDGRDDPALAWNLWWVPYSILHLGASPIYTDYMFYPIGLNLAYYTLTYLNAFLSIPFQFAFNLVVAANVNLLLSFVLSGYGTFLLVRYLLIQNSKFKHQNSNAFVFLKTRHRTAVREKKEPRDCHCEEAHLADEAISDSKDEIASSPSFDSAQDAAPLRTLLAITDAAGPAREAAPENSNFEFLILNFCAFAAGALYAFSSNKMLYASLGQFNIASSQWIPFYVLFLLKITQSRKSSSILHPSSFILGLFLLFQALSELIFASFLILFTIMYLVYWLAANRHRLGELRPVLANLAVAAVIFVVPMAPILSAMIRDMLVEGDYIQRGVGFADVFSNDLLGFFVPSHLNPFLGSLASQFHFAYTNFAYLGWVALVVAVLALVKVPRARIWGLFGALFILITLGPDLRVNGQAIPAPFLPFNLLLDIPFIKGNRYPSRWSVMVTLALAALVGYGLYWASQKAKGKGQKLKGKTENRHSLLRFAFCLLGLPSFAFLLLTLLEHLSVPLPTTDLSIPSVYATIAQEPGDFSLLEIPLAWRNGFRQTGTPDEEMMFEQWYQTEHQHPILGGNTSRNPELKFQYFAEAPVISSLIAVENGHALDADRLQVDKRLAPEVLRFFGVRFVVWHSPRQPQNRATLDAARRYVEQTWPIVKISDVTDEMGETVAYRVADMPAPSAVTITPSDPLARLYFGEGWGTLSEERFVWAQRSEVRLLARLDAQGRDARIELSAIAPPGISEQGVQVIVNGQAVGRITLTGCLDCKTGLTIPAGALRAGMNEMILWFDRTLPVAGIRSGNYLPYVSSRPVNVVLRSAGEEQGDFGHIYLEGREVSPNARGYNLVVLDPNTDAVVSAAAFDTFASEAESARMAEFIRGIPDGYTVLAVVRDEASRRLTADAVIALRSIGAAVDLRGKFRWSHAIIGVKGAAPGTVREEAWESDVAQLVSGIGVTEPKVAAAIEWIKIEAR